jgi:integrase
MKDSPRAKRTRALDSRGRPVPGIYMRPGEGFYAGLQVDGRWTMQRLAARTLTEAKRERASLLAALDEGRAVARDGSTFESLFTEWQGARRISERTAEHERHLLDRHLKALKARRVQDVDARALARLLRGLRERTVDGKPKPYSPWTMTAVYRIIVGTFTFAAKRGVIARSPADGLVDTEKPQQKNQKEIALLDSEKMTALVRAGASERWRAALGLAGYAALRLGEIRGLKWSDVSFTENTISVRRSLLPSGEPKATKSEAGTRTVTLYPELRRVLRRWQIKSPYTAPDDYIVCAAGGVPVMERNLRRALAAAIAAAGIAPGEKRLSWHALRHSAGSIWLTEQREAHTTVSAMMGHSNPAFTLKCYGRDPRDEQTIVADVLKRAAEAGIWQ